MYEQRLENVIKVVMDVGPSHTSVGR
jgi:hypothetical protein